MEHLNSWKNKRVFEKQLILNCKELDSGMKKGDFPSHWQALLDFIKVVQTIYKQQTLDIDTVRTFLDIGCGCGAVSELIRLHYPEIEYTGMDYATEAVDIASKQWPDANFIEKDYKDITSEEVNQYNIVCACSLHNVLPDGDDAINTLLALNPKYLILSKILTTPNKSYFETYQAYNEIITYKYFHNYQKLHDKLFGWGHCMERPDGPFVYHYLLGRNDVK